jgi:hypothetical protein
MGHPVFIRDCVSMKISIVLGVATLLQCISALAVSPRHPSGVISAPVWRRDETRSVENDLTRRSKLTKRQTADTVALPLDNPPVKLLYFANSTSTLS